MGREGISFSWSHKEFLTHGYITRKCHWGLPCPLRPTHCGYTSLPNREVLILSDQCLQGKVNQYKSNVKPDLPFRQFPGIIPFLPMLGITTLLQVIYNNTYVRMYNNVSHKHMSAMWYAL